jgi:hypothetical protein
MTITLGIRRDRPLAPGTEIALKKNAKRYHAGTATVLAMAERATKWGTARKGYIVRRDGAIGQGAREIFITPGEIESVRAIVSDRAVTNHLGERRR